MQGDLTLTRSLHWSLRPALWVTLVALWAGSAGATCRDAGTLAGDPVLLRFNENACALGGWLDARDGALARDEEFADQIERMAQMRTLLLAVQERALKEGELDGTLVVLLRDYTDLGLRLLVATEHRAGSPYLGSIRDLVFGGESLLPTQLAVGGSPEVKQQVEELRDALKQTLKDLRAECELRYEDAPRCGHLLRGRIYLDRFAASGDPKDFETARRSLDGALARARTVEHKLAARYLMVTLAVEASPAAQNMAEVEVLVDDALEAEVDALLMGRQTALDYLADGRHAEPDPRRVIQSAYGLIMTRLSNALTFDTHGPQLLHIARASADGPRFSSEARLVERAADAASSSGDLETAVALQQRAVHLLRVRGDLVEGDLPDSARRLILLLQKRGRLRDIVDADALRLEFRDAVEAPAGPPSVPPSDES